MSSEHSDRRRRNQQPYQHKKDIDHYGERTSTKRTTPHSNHWAIESHALQNQVAERTERRLLRSSRSRSRSSSYSSSHRRHDRSYRRRTNRKESRRRRSDYRNRSRSRNRSHSRSVSSESTSSNSRLRDRFSRSSSRSYKLEKRKGQKRGKRRRSGSKGDQSDSSSRDDNSGHFQGGPGTDVGRRYRIVRDLGLGTFGRVVECQTRHESFDNRDVGNVAIKIVRNVRRYYDNALIEADICERVDREQCRQNKDWCARMLDRFSLPSGHYCLVFERLGISLYEFLKLHNYRPFPMYCVVDFSRQLLETLAFLHGFGLIHTDLKPENILLSRNETELFRSPDGCTQHVPYSTKVKVIDFGCATFDNEKKSTTINTRQYRGPEVILGWGWSYPSDLWSLGCIIAELYTGHLLFATHDNVEHLALMENVVGRFQKGLLDHFPSPLAKQCFDARGYHKMDAVLSRKSMTHIRKVKPIEELVLHHDRSSGLGRLLKCLLTIDPNRRATAKEALSLSFFRRRS